MVHFMLLSGLIGSTLVGPCCSAQKESGSKPDAATRALEQLKSLTGEWVETNADGHAKGATAVVYRTTAGGSAVLEILFPGTEMEMASVYHRDGKNLVMTHYCMVGNQPRMQARLTDDSNRIAFELVGGSNLDPSKDAHIHGGFIELIDRNHIRSEWEFFRDGKLIEAHKFDLVRKPPVSQSAK